MGDIVIAFLILAALVVGAIYWNKRQDKKEQPKPDPVVDPIPKPEPPVEETPLPEPNPEDPLSYEPVVSLTSDSTSLHVTWKDTKDAEGYTYYRKQGSGGWDFHTDLSENEFKDEGLEPDKLYIVLVQAKTPEGDFNSEYYNIYTKPKVRPKPTKKIYTIDYDVDATEDQTDYIMEQIESFPDGHSPSNRITWEFPKQGRVWTEGLGYDWTRDVERAIITLTHRKNIDIQGEGVTLFTKKSAVEAGSRTYGNYSLRKQLALWNCLDISAYGLGIEGSSTVEGDKPGFPQYHKNRELEHGVEIMGSKGIKFYGVKVYGVNGDGFYLGARRGEVFEDILLQDCSVKWAGRQGTAFGNSGRYATVDNMYMDGIRRSGIDWENWGESGALEHITIRNSEIHCALTPFAAKGHGRVDNIAIENNKYTGSYYSLYCLTGHPEELIIRKNWKFIGNERLDNRGGDAIKLGYVDNVIIADNKDNFDGDYYVAASFVRNLQVTNNTIPEGKIIRAAMVEGLETDMEVFDNSAAVAPESLLSYEEAKKLN